MGDALADVLLATGRPLCFEELCQAVPAASLTQVAGWLGHALQIGFVEEVDRAETATSERCFRLRARGRRILGTEKRGHARRR